MSTKWVFIAGEKIASDGIMHSFTSLAPQTAQTEFQMTGDGNMPAAWKGGIILMSRIHEGGIGLKLLDEIQE